MTEFRTTATHDGRAVPMPEVNAAECDAYKCCNLWSAYHRAGTTPHYDANDFRDRIAADARASAAPSEDAIRAAKFEALSEAVTGMALNLSADRCVTWLREMRDNYAPHPVYAAPVRLSDGTFGQTGPNEFTRVWVTGASQEGDAKFWRRSPFFPADGALVLAVLDGAEATR